MIDDEQSLSSIRLGNRPLLVCDVDDVVLQFIAPFQRFLDERELKLLPRSFRLLGNIESVDGKALEDAMVRELIALFFELQEQWQEPAEQAVHTLAKLSEQADVVFLTAMPPRYAEQRRRLLDALGLHFPMIASENAKGPLVDRLHGRRPLPVAFVDDMIYNLASVGEHVEDCLLVHLQPVSDLHRHAPVTPESARAVRDWDDAYVLLDTHFSGR